MAKEFLTDSQVEKEIERLTKSEDVRLARREARLKNRRRQFLYNLRALEKRGKELRENGIDLDSLDEMMQEVDADYED